MLEKIKSFLFKNTSTKQTIAKNSFWLTVSNFGGRIVKAGVVIYGARLLGTAGYGVFSYAITLAGFFTLFMDPGVNGILLRDASAADDKQRRTIFSTIFFIKLALITIGVLIIAFIAPLFSTLPGAKALLPIVAIILFFDTTREFFLSLVRAMEKMEWEAGIFIFTNFAILVFGLAFIFHSSTPLALGWGYALGTAAGAIAAIYFMRDYLRNLTSHFSRKLVLPILRNAWPFAVTGALGLLLTNTDILIVSWIRTASDVGIYSAAIRIIQVLYLLPVIFQYSTLPVLARLARRDDEKFRAGFERIILLVFLLSIPMALGGLILGTQIMSFVFGTAYAPGGFALKILMLTMIIDYPGTIIVTSIFAYNHQRSLIISSIIGGVLNVLLDILLIPRFGITGSAIGTFIATFASNAYLWHIMNGVNPFSVLPRLGKVAGASIIMALACLGLLVANVNVVLNILACTLLYIGLLKLFREPLFGDLLASVKTRIS